MGARKRVTIRSRLGEHEGVTDGIVAYFDSLNQKTGGKTRHFVILDQNVDLQHEPWDWKDRRYVDLVQVKSVDEYLIELKDLYVDIIIEGNGPTYRVIDLEELGDALESGQIQLSEIAGPLRNLQQFLDGHVHGAKEFPPECIRPFMTSV